MQTLSEYLVAENNKTRAWIAEDPTNRCATTWTEDMAHWNKDGIYTVEDFELYNMQSSYSDAHKDAYGFRPRHDTSDWTHADWKRELDRVYDALDAEMVRIAEAEEVAVAAYEKLIVETIANGAADRETAIVWIIQGMDYHVSDYYYGPSHFCYDMGLPYATEDSLKAAWAVAQSQAEEQEVA
jgi:hypothetical protein